MTYNIENNTVQSHNSDKVIDHCFGIDFNSIYPSVFVSVKHDFCKYTGGKIFIPGLITNYYESNDEIKNLYDMKYIRDLILGQNKHSTKPILFSDELKGFIQKERLNEFINFLPIFRKVEMKQDEKSIESSMNEYMKSHKMSVYNKTRLLFTSIIVIFNICIY